MNNEMKITDIQIFEYEDKFSANIAINDEFMLQLGTDGSFSIPPAHEAVWNNDMKQQNAHDTYDAYELAIALRIPTDKRALKKYAIC